MFPSGKCNPSFGLWFWGPLVPASDNTTALRLLTGIQLCLGVGLMYRANLFRKHVLHRSMIANSWDKRARKYVYAAAGGLLVYQSGFETVRLTLPYDPWYEEAKYHRELAVKNGSTPSWWWGAIDLYTPMTVAQFHDSFERWATDALEHTKIDSHLDFNSLNKYIVTDARPHLHLVKILDHQRFAANYATLLADNRERFSSILKDWESVNELNKAERIDLVLEGNANINTEYKKPGIKLGTNPLTEETFEDIWYQFDPWDELKMETDYDIRLIPRYKTDETA